MADYSGEGTLGTETVNTAVGHQPDTWRRTLTCKAAGLAARPHEDAPIGIETAALAGRPSAPERLAVPIGSAGLACLRRTKAGAGEGGFTTATRTAKPRWAANPTIGHSRIGHAGRRGQTHLLIHPRHPRNTGHGRHASVGDHRAEIAVRVRVARGAGRTAGGLALASGQVADSASAAIRRTQALDAGTAPGVTQLGRRAPHAATGIVGACITGDGYAGASTAAGLASCAVRGRGAPPVASTGETDLPRGTRRRGSVHAGGAAFDARVHVEDHGIRIAAASAEKKNQGERQPETRVGLVGR